MPRTHPAPVDTVVNGFLVQAVAGRRLGHVYWSVVCEVCARAAQVRASALRKGLTACQCQAQPTQSLAEQVRLLTLRVAALEKQPKTHALPATPKNQFNAAYPCSKAELLRGVASREERDRKFADNLSRIAAITDPKDREELRARLAIAQEEAEITFNTSQQNTLHAHFRRLTEPPFA